MSVILLGLSTRAGPLSGQHVSAWAPCCCRPAMSLPRCIAPQNGSQHPVARGWRYRRLPVVTCVWQGQRDSSSLAHQVQRALGVDYGRRVVGLAVSTLGLAPRPLEGLPGGNSGEQLQLAASLLDVAQREGCDAVVIGLPVTESGSLRMRSSDSQQGRRCRNFAGNVATLAESRSITVFLADERGSTLEAAEVLAYSGSRRSNFSKRKDSVAAAIILESFFRKPQEAVFVKPWRPQRASVQRPRQQQQQQQPQRQQPIAATQQRRADQQQQQQQDPVD